MIRIDIVDILLAIGVNARGFLTLHRDAPQVALEKACGGLCHDERRQVVSCDFMNHLVDRHIFSDLTVQGTRITKENTVRTIAGIVGLSLEWATI